MSLHITPTGADALAAKQAAQAVGQQCAICGDEFAEHHVGEITLFEKQLTHLSCWRGYKHWRDIIGDAIVPHSLRNPDASPAETEPHLKSIDRARQKILHHLAENPDGKFWSVELSKGLGISRSSLMAALRELRDESRVSFESAAHKLLYFHKG